MRDGDEKADVRGGELEGALNRGFSLSEHRGPSEGDGDSDSGSVFHDLISLGRGKLSHPEQGL